MFGRIIRVDLDTNTVDIQFEGRRQTTVGSKFSVEHDYAFTTEYLGKVEIVYLAGGNRAIAKPGQRTYISQMGKGDRVGGLPCSLRRSRRSAILTLAGARASLPFRPRLAKMRLPHFPPRSSAGTTSTKGRLGVE